jgi:hypothetical protein
MNKRLLFIGGGIFSVLLVAVALISATLDQSSFYASISSENSNKSFLNFEKLVDAATISAPELSPPEATPVMDTTVISRAIEYANSELFGNGTSRLETIISTNKLVYKARDVVFIEVAVFDALSKTPYLPKINNNQTTEA